MKNYSINYLIKRISFYTIIKKKALVEMNLFNLILSKRILLILALNLIITPFVFAEGSKDLYPSGVQGGRAALFVGSNTTSHPAIPFPTRGTHFVYAKAGEQIAVASSLQSDSTKRLFIYAPNGNDVTPTGGSSPSSSRGNIPNRNGELAGPRLPDQGTGGNRYTPVYYTVPSGGEGIYRIEFAGTGDGNSINSRISYVAANNNWTQPSESNYLMAWDISVAKQVSGSWEWAVGRVYTTVLGMDNPSFESSSPYPFRSNGGFYGKLKVLTNDGFVYNVNNNGNNGLTFTFMVNNKGFYDTNPTVPSYRSRNATTVNDITQHYHDPRSADENGIYTQKIFYNIPDGGMPESSVGAVPGGSTWLRPPRASLQVNNIDFEGAEGTIGQAGMNGGFFIFDNDGEAEYTIIIEGNNVPDRVISGIAVEGENRIYWDGNDGAGNPYPIGQAPVTVTIQLKGAEVHFPFIDMELNQNGIILELLDETLTTVESDKVYWDDTGLSTSGVNGTVPNPINASHTAIPDGTSSNLNGHKWGSGTNNSTGSFGDNKGIDTWTFVKGEEISEQFSVEILSADLKVSSISLDNSCVAQNDIVTYSVKVGNDGPSDADKAVFFFYLPDGFNLDSYNFNGSGCGSQVSGAFHYESSINAYVDTINIASNCEVTYTFDLKLIDSDIFGNVEAIAAILRPNDVTDPDATNTDGYPFTAPYDPYYECENNGLTVDCNNILNNTDLSIRPEIIVDRTTPASSCGGNDGEIHFKFNNLEDGVYTIVYNGGSWNNVIVSNGEAVIQNVSPGSYNGVTVTSLDCTSPSVTVYVAANCIIANSDNYGPFDETGGTTGNVLDNDELNGDPVDPNDVTLTWGDITDEDDNDVTSGFTLNPDGTITVDTDVPAGEYTITYTICEDLNPTNCDEATVTITVEAAEIEANDDTFGPINGAEGGTTGNVLDNDELNGDPVDPNDVTLTWGEITDEDDNDVTSGFTLNPDGTITVDTDVPAGEYTITYTICEDLNPTNCDGATVTITVEAADIEANDDTFGPINGAEGGTTDNVLDNDKLNGDPVDPNDVTLTWGNITDEDDNDVTSGFTLNPDGTIDVDPGLPSGVYTITYTICEKTNPSNCDDAVVTIVIEGCYAGDTPVIIECE